VWDNGCPHGLGPCSSRFDSYHFEKEEKKMKTLKRKVCPYCEAVCLVFIIDIPEELYTYCLDCGGDFATSEQMEESLRRVKRLKLWKSTMGNK
jgi:hypothetical protein